MEQEINNGIIIGGVLYLPVAASDPLRKCKKCALRSQCFGIGPICDIFGAFLYYFVRQTNKENGK